jgi:hypothetical protein
VKIIYSDLFEKGVSLKVDNTTIIGTGDNSDKNIENDNENVVISEAI